MGKMRFTGGWYWSEPIQNALRILGALQTFEMTPNHDIIDALHKPMQDEKMERFTLVTVQCPGHWTCWTGESSC